MSQALTLDYLWPLIKLSESLSLSRCIRCTKIRRRKSSKGISLKTLFLHVLFRFPGFEQRGILTTDSWFTAGAFKCFTIFGRGCPVLPIFLTLLPSETNDLLVC